VAVSVFPLPPFGPIMTTIFPSEPEAAPERLAMTLPSVKRT
jgi:hypothetical protein